jgi:hypothetical protein
MRPFISRPARRLPARNSPAFFFPARFRRAGAPESAMRRNAGGGETRDRGIESSPEIRRRRPPAASSAAGDPAAAEH